MVIELIRKIAHLEVSCISTQSTSNDIYESEEGVGFQHSAVYREYRVPSKGITVATGSNKIDREIDR